MKHKSIALTSYEYDNLLKEYGTSGAKLIISAMTSGMNLKEAIEYTNYIFL